MNKVGPAPEEEEEDVKTPKEQSPKADSIESTISHKTPLIQVTTVVHPDDEADENFPNDPCRVPVPIIGIENPVFNDDEIRFDDNRFQFPDDDVDFRSEIDDIHTPLPTPWPIHRGSNPNVFVFDPDCESLYSRRGSYSLETMTRPKFQKTARRGSTGQNGSDKSSLTVPSIKQLRTGDQSNGLKPSHQDSASDYHIPPPSPGILSTNSAWSELLKINTSRKSSDAGLSDFSRSNSLSISNVSSSLSEHLRYLIRAFSSRTEKVKESTLQPPSPSSLSDYAGSDALSAISAEPQVRHRLDSFLPDQPEGDTISEIVRIREEELSQHTRKYKLPRWLTKLKFPHVIEPQSKLYLIWLFVVTLAFMYNAWVIPLRLTFPYQTDSNLKYWLIADYLCDFVYIVDILFFKMRITFLNSGLKETHRKSTRANYMKKDMFKYDVLSLLPLDLFYLINMKVNPWYRLPRLLKIQTFWEFYSRCDHLLRSAHAVRIVKTMTYMLFLIHIETCGYYAVSVYEGLNSNPWVYNGVGNAYIRCFYLATKTATSIGNNPKPINQLEYLFMTIYWMSGVFVFALLIGQIRDIVDAANSVKTIYTQKMDAVINYGKNMNLPKDTQDRVRTWFIYNWQQQKIIDEGTLMDTLPMKLRKDLAIHVHFNTLSKVKLFQDCDKTLLYDLVLKLRPILYLPGDYVCKKGEIGKEMYIVSQGIVEVVGGPNNSLVLATLKEGSVFGEISLLAMAAEGNRRTADVRCKGFTNLFTLSKNDFEAAMKDYPDAHKLLKKRAKKLLRLNARIERKSQSSIEHNRIKAETIIRTPPETPKMVKTVIQVMDPDSSIIRHIHGFDHDDCNTSGDKVEVNEIGSDNRAYETGSEYNVSGKAPTPQEVEQFFDEILAEHICPEGEPSEPETETSGLVMNGNGDDVGDNDDTGDTGSQKKKTSNSSTSSTDSGVQDTKSGSPVPSTTRTFSNKDSKESFISTELGDILEGSEYSDDDSTQPTIEGINYTADMFGDIERRHGSNTPRDITDETKIARFITKPEFGKPDLLTIGGNEYAKAFAQNFEITVEAVDDSLPCKRTIPLQPANNVTDSEVVHIDNKTRVTSPIVETIDETSVKDINNETKVVKDTPVISDKISDKKPVSRKCVKNQREDNHSKGKARIAARSGAGRNGTDGKSCTTTASALYRTSHNNTNPIKPTTKQTTTKNTNKSKKPKDINKDDVITESTEDSCVDADNTTRCISVCEAKETDSVNNVSSSPIISGNQITFFAEVHREKTMSPRTKREDTLSPTAVSSDLQSQRQRKISVISIGTVLQDGRETLV